MKKFLYFFVVLIACVFCAPLVYDAPKVYADENLLKQLYFNLLKNSLESMQRGGSITITAKALDEFVCIEFSDTGCGIDEDNMAKLELMNQYLIKEFKLAFGNRIMKQLNDYVPCYMACGGTEIEAIDFMVAKKVLRKFESLNLGYMKNELTALQSYLDHNFGKDAMAICKDYIEQLKKMN